MSKSTSTKEIEGGIQRYELPRIVGRPNFKVLRRDAVEYAYLQSRGPII